MTLRMPYSFRRIGPQNEIKDTYYPWRDARDGTDRRGENRRKHERRSFPRPPRQTSEPVRTPTNYLSNLLTQEERDFIEYLTRSEEELDMLS